MTYAVDNRPAKGTAIVARKWTEALIAAQDQFDLTFVHYEKCDDPIYHHGVKEVIFPEFKWKFFNRRSLRQVYYFLTTKDRYDIVQWFQPRLYPFFWRAPADHIVVAVHGAGDIGKANAFNVMRHVFNWTVILFRKHIAIATAGSQYAAQDIIKKYKFDPAQVRIIHYGAEESFEPATSAEVDAVKKKYNLPEKFFLNIARLNPGKNAYPTIRAFDRFARTHPEADVHFVNVGDKGTDRPLIDAFIRASPVRERIHLVGYIETQDLPALYSAALALVFPLIGEGFGLPVMEGMRCGTPMVIAETSYPEVQHDEAVLVDAWSEDSIAKGMETIYNDPELRVSMARKGLERAKHFTWKESGEKLIAAYKELML